MRETCDRACTELAEKGERVLGFADLVLDSTYNKDFKFCAEPANFPRKDLRFVGFMSLIDPPRPQVITLYIDYRMIKRTLMMT